MHLQNGLSLQPLCTQKKCPKMSDEDVTDQYNIINMDFELGYSDTQKYRDIRYKLLLFSYPLDPASFTAMWLIYTFFLLANWDLQMNYSKKLKK